MKTKPGSSLSTSSGGGSGRSHSKRGSGSRERDRDRDKLKLAVSGESGASSQCDTPPLTEKEWGAGKMAGVGPESVMCMAEQVGVEINSEAAAAFAEDVSFKLRQIIHSIAVHSQLARRTRVEMTDVNSVLQLMDTDPVLGPGPPVWQPLLDDYCYEAGPYSAKYMTRVMWQVSDKTCKRERELKRLILFPLTCFIAHLPHHSCHVFSGVRAQDEVVCTRDAALSPQTYMPAARPSLNVQWVSDERSLAGSTDINPALRAYCMQISKALLKGSKKVKQVALEDLATNPRIGCILPNLFNLAVLVLNDENLNTLHVPVKEPLKCIILDMVEALCANRCSSDTDVQKQLQRLYPALVADILNAGPLADKMILVITKIACTWPAFVHIGEKTLYDYLKDGHSERVSGAVVSCLVALGRRALLRCLEPHLDYVDVCMHLETQPMLNHIDLTGAVLEASSLLLRPEPDTYLEDHVTIDYAMYEMIGDAILPRRILPIISEMSSEGSLPPTEVHQDEDIVLYAPVRTVTHRPRIRVLPPRPKPPFYHRDTVFEPSTFRFPHIKFNIKGSRTRQITNKKNIFNNYNSYAQISNKVAAASGKLSRFRYKLPNQMQCPIFASYLL